MPRRTLDLEKITLSLPKDLVRYADMRAAELGVSRSQLIGEAVAQARSREEEALAREGYAFYRHESEEFAAASLSAVSVAVISAD